MEVRKRKRVVEVEGKEKKGQQEKVEEEVEGKKEKEGGEGVGEKRESSKLVASRMKVGYIQFLFHVPSPFGRGLG